VPDQIVAANELVVGGSDVGDVVAPGVIEDITFWLGGEVLVFSVNTIWGGEPQKDKYLHVISWSQLSKLVGIV
jgi:hypothetical protein